jgi:mRNA interferase RelE/StbE
LKALFLESFEKDLKKIKDKKTLKSLQNLILTVESATFFNGIPRVKKLVGFKDAFRIRLGNYIVGIFLERENVIFARIAHRRDIYSLFP